MTAAANKYDVKIISAALKDSHASSVVIVNFRQQIPAW